jgi:hypothetical protein
MPLPFLAVAAIGALVGGGAVYVAEERQKDKLKKCVSDLERQQEKMARQIQQAADREVRHRKEKIQVLLKYYNARTMLMLDSSTISPARFARLSATSKQLITISNRLGTDGNPHPQDKQFIEIIQKAMNAKQTGNPPTKLDMAHLDQYLEQECPGAMIEVMQEMLGKQFSDKQKLLTKLSSERREKLLKIAQLEKLIEWNEVDASTNDELKICKARMTVLPQEKSDLEKSIQQLRMQLVVLTILSDPNLKTPHDHLVENIIQRQIQGRPLTQQEEQLLKTYQVTYFKKAKDALAKKEIHLVA